MNNCPKCQAPLPEGSGTSCQRCLLKEGARLAVSNHFRAGSFLPPEPDEIGLLFPDFEIQSLIGRGGMGAVYQAHDLKNDRRVAIKILPPEIAADSEFLGRFYAEAATLEHLTHPHIVSLYEFGEREDYAFFVMEYVPGMDLARRLQQESKLELEAIKRIIHQVCDALEYSHSQGVIHRDIKPANILIDDEGNAKIADFGLAKLRLPGDTEKGLTLTRAIMGTMNYMAPETSLGIERTDHRVDVYATGVVLYEMLTGKIPAGRFDLPSSQIKGLDRKIDRVVERALSMEPAKRYQSASQLKEALAKVSNRSSELWKYGVGIGLVSSLAVAAIFHRQPDTSLNQEILMPLSGTILIEELDTRNTTESVSVKLSESTSEGITPNASSDRGDFWLNFPVESVTTKGTLVTSIAELTSTNVISSFSIKGEDPCFVVDVHRVGVRGGEANVKAAFGWFPFDEYLGAYALRISNTDTLRFFTGSDGIELGKQVVPVGSSGVVTIDLRKFGATSDRGILMVNVAENSNCFAMVEPRDNGVFNLHTVSSIRKRYIPRCLSFVYLPLDQVGKGKIRALGRVHSNGSASVSAGNFNLMLKKPGQWQLTLPDEDLNEGTLLLSPILTPEGNNEWNFVSYEWNPASKSCIIQSKDLKTKKLEGGAFDNEPMFNFVYLKK